MRTEDKYILGTPHEIAEYIIDKSLGFRGELNALYRTWSFPQLSNYSLTPYDFAVADEFVDLEKCTLEEIKASSSGWYGIKQIDAGFDYQGIDLIADYYGGRCMVCGELELDYSRAECIAIVEEMIMNVLNIQDTCHEDTLLIAEPAE